MFLRDPQPVANEDPRRWQRATLVYMVDDEILYSDEWNVSIDDEVSDWAEWLHDEGLMGRLGR